MSLRRAARRLELAARLAHARVRARCWVRAGHRPQWSYVRETVVCRDCGRVL